MDAVTAEDIQRVAQDIIGKHHYRPRDAAAAKKYDAAEGDYTGACLPFGMTRSMNTPEPMQLMQSDKYLGFLFEQNSWFTVVPIDGRKFNTDPKRADLYQRLRDRVRRGRDEPGMGGLDTEDLERSVLVLENEFARAPLAFSK